MEERGWAEVESRVKDVISLEEITEKEEKAYITGRLCKVNHSKHKNQRAVLHE